MLQIPTDVVRNSNYKLDDKSFTVYAFLLYKKFRAYTQEFEVDHLALRHIVGISDNRTFKKCLDKLSDIGLIGKIEKLPTRGELSVNVYDYEGSSKFTQLPISLLYQIHNVGCTGFRLLYYYESFINRKRPTMDYCFVAFETVQEDLKMSSKTINKYNDILVEMKYLSITKHEVFVDEYLDASRFTKYNNHYKVNREQMKKKK